MKKMILSAAAVIVMASCAKDHKCTCTYSNNLPGNTPYTVEHTMVETTKGQAKANCISGTSTSTSGTLTVIDTQDCKLS